MCVISLSVAATSFTERLGYRIAGISYDNKVTMASIHERKLFVK